MRISDWSSDVCSSDLRTEAYDLAFIFGEELALGEIVDLAADLRRRIALGAAIDFCGQASDPGGVAGFGVADDEFRPGRVHGFDIGRRAGRSDERRVGTECVCTCKYRCLRYQ